MYLFDQSVYNYTPVLFNQYKEIKQNLDWNHLMVFFKVFILVVRYYTKLAQSVTSFTEMMTNRNSIIISSSYARVVPAFKEVALMFKANSE